MSLFQALSVACVAFVLAGLLWVLVRRNECIIRPSYIFLAFFWLQVQFASAVNAPYIETQLANPWVYFLLIQLFPVALLLLIFVTFREKALEVSAHIRGWSDRATLPSLVGRAAVLLCVVGLVFAGYLTFVPFQRTGLYALLFEPQLADQYRELSMKLANLGWFHYPFTLMEKALAPLAGAYVALIIALLWSRSRRMLLPVAALGLVLATLPTTIYGARGPAVMVFVAAIFAFVVARGRRPTPWLLIGAVVIALVPAVVIMALKSESFAPRVLLYQAGNILDRAVGRTFCDNVSHVAYVQENGFHGIGAIEKLAPIFGVDAVDPLNKVGRKLYTECRSYGLAFLQFGEDPLQSAEAERLAAELGKLQALSPASLTSELAARRAQLEKQLIAFEHRKAEIAAQLERMTRDLAVDLRETTSAGASFVVLNYSMFGLWFIVPSLLFAIGLDLLLYAYARMPAEGAIIAIGASVVPILTLCFSLWTTVLASKGLLMVPLLAWLVSRVPDAWFSAGHWRALVATTPLQSVLARATR